MALYCGWSGVTCACTRLFHCPLAYGTDSLSESSRVKIFAYFLKITFTLCWYCFIFVFLQLMLYFLFYCFLHFHGTESAAFCQLLLHLLIPTLMVQWSHSCWWHCITFCLQNENEKTGNSLLWWSNLCSNEKKAHLSMYQLAITL